MNDGFIQDSADIKRTTIWSADDADNILVFLPSENGYSVDYTFYACGDVSADFENPEEDIYSGKWLKQADDEPADYTIPADKSFFYWSRKAADEDFTLTFAGSVKATPVDVVCEAGWLNMCANPYPAPVAINGKGAFDWNVLGAKSTTIWSVDDADNIMLYEDGGYSVDNTFYFCGDVSADFENPEEDVYSWKWLAQADDEPTEAFIPAGAGFWYWRRGETNLTLPFASPVAK